MSNKENWFANLPARFIPDAGGSLFGKARIDDGLILADTDFGEMGVDITDQGDLMAIFPELGLMLGYSQEGDIRMAIVDIGMYLSRLPIDLVEAMPNGGRDVMALVKKLYDEKLSMMLRLVLGEDEQLRLVVLEEDGSEAFGRDSDMVNFGRGMGGDVGLEENHMVSFGIIRSGDDLRISFGEGRNRDTYAGIDVSLWVDFENNIFGNDPRRLRKLANKIILD